MCVMPLMLTWWAVSRRRSAVVEWRCSDVSRAELSQSPRTLQAQPAAEHSPMSVPLAHEIKQGKRPQQPTSVIRSCGAG